MSGIEFLVGFWLFVCVSCYFFVSFRDGVFALALRLMSFDVAVVVCFLCFCYAFLAL